MRETIRVGKDEWESLLKDAEKMVHRHSVLLKKVNELEESNTDLRQKLKETSEQLRKAEEEKHAARIKIERLESDAEKGLSFSPSLTIL